MTFLIYTRRMLRHPSVVLMLLCLPLLAFIFRGFAEKSEGAVIGIYTQTPSPEITRYLLQNEDAFKFKLYSSADDMRRDVETQLLECGFILPPNISDVEGISIVCGEGYASVLSDVTKEAVFAAVLKVCGDKAAYSFAKKSNIDINNEDFKKSYQKYVETTPVCVSFEEVPTTEVSSAKKRSLPQSMAAAVLACAVLIGSTFYIGDRKKGVYFGAGRCVAAALLLFALSALAALAICGARINIIRFCLLLAALWGVGCIAAKIIKNDKVPWLLMPVVILFVILFDIICIADIVPALGIVPSFLPTHYYIFGTAGAQALYSVVLLCCGIAADKMIK